ncbi:uncharacterized protein STEHIDRAFT_122929 [Stereum hirsutum FP-91666 SS1]|uniref:uncharacterized protein n=1 Tax=Stereum hirsutum (strain FP-91666) TaxID=721885 RepID=UPI0004449562|nr:uncharacterized protein STEHIDRAFT_122929 [Stereum hirsutum FP-91666 SS1]EIM85015.1 hypothetical protein STEHIDRAFT_122929 [Stereum hirsutum FP-91666 SS1]
MFSFSKLAALALASAAVVSASDIYVQVGGNTSTNASLVFQPQLITAVEGDIVFFNFTQGNHTVTQSTFASPCIAAHETNSSINGFDSGFRDTVNGTAVTILSVPITADIANQTLWFFDYNTCGEGGVGGINPNQSSLETLAGFERNAERLNGTASSSTSGSHSSTRTASSSSSTSSSTSSDSSGAEKMVALGALSSIPLFIAGLLL